MYIIKLIIIHFYISFLQSTLQQRLEPRYNKAVCLYYLQIIYTNSQDMDYTYRAFFMMVRLKGQDMKFANNTRWCHLYQSN